MKNKNLKKIKYVSGNPQNAGICTIYPTASGGLGGPQTPGLNCSASLRSPFSTYFFKIAPTFESVESPGLGTIIDNAYTKHLSTVSLKVVSRTRRRKCTLELRPFH